MGKRALLGLGSYYVWVEGSTRTCNSVMQRRVGNATRTSMEVIEGSVGGCY